MKKMNAVFLLLLAIFIPSCDDEVKRTRDEHLDKRYELIVRSQANLEYYTIDMESLGENKIEEKLTPLWAEIPDSLEVVSQQIENRIKLHPETYDHYKEENLYLEMSFARIEDISKDGIQHPKEKYIFKNRCAAFNYVITNPGKYIIYGRLMNESQDFKKELYRFERPIFISGTKEVELRPQDLMQLIK